MTLAKSPHWEQFLHWTCMFSNRTIQTLLTDIEVYFSVSQHVLLCLHTSLLPSSGQQQKLVNVVPNISFPPKVQRLLISSSLAFNRRFLASSLSNSWVCLLFSASRFLMLSLARFKITTFEALSLLDSSGTWSLSLRKQFFSSLRLCLSITLCVRRLSSSSSMSAPWREARFRERPEFCALRWESPSTRLRLREGAEQGEGGAGGGEGGRGAA